jgi:hypothetical protein
MWLLVLELLGPPSESPVYQAEFGLDDVRVRSYTSASLGGPAPDRGDAQPRAALGEPLVVGLRLDHRIERVF